MRTLLAAVETGEAKDLKPTAAAALGALEAALADLAIDLDGITAQVAPRRSGMAALSLRRPHGVRAPPRRGDRRRHRQPHRDALSRRAALPRCCQAYLAEFEALLARAKEATAAAF
ncbi:MAG: hypothetical protein WDM81_16525 [Rhizomicrobium sp.]